MPCRRRWPGRCGVRRRSGAGHGAHAAGDLDPQLAHPDYLFRWVVVEGNPQVVGESEVVAGPVPHPGSPGRAVSSRSALRRAALSTIPVCAASGEVPLLLGEQRGLDPGVPGAAGGCGGILGLEQRVDGLLGPDHVELLPVSVTAASPADMRVAQRVPGHAGVGVIRCPGVVARRSR